MDNQNTPLEVLQAESCVQSQEPAVPKQPGPFDHLPRCQAHARSTGQRCKNVALKGKRVCYLHGGHAGPPRNNVNARKHGLRGREYREIRRELRRIKEQVNTMEEAQKQAAQIQKLAEKVDAQTDAALAAEEQKRRAAFARAMRKLLATSRGLPVDIEASPEWDQIKPFIPPNRRP